MRVFRHYVSPAKVLLATIDFTLLILSAGVSTWARFQAADLDFSIGYGMVMSFVGFAALTSPILIGLGAYDYESLRNLRAFLVRAGLSLSVAAILIAAVGFLLPGLTIWRSILAITFVVSLVGLTVAHGIFNAIIGNRVFDRKTILVGSGKRASAVLEYLSDAREHGMSPIAVFPVEGDEICEKSRPLLREDLRLLDLTETLDADTLVIATERQDNLPMQDLISLRLTGVDIIGHQAFYEEIRGYVKLEDLSPEWLLYADGFKGTSALSLTAKRVVDILVSTLVLLASSPLWFTAGILVMVTSPGGMFYKQTRVGRLGKPFKVMKLRTMVQDAEKAGAQWAQSNDPRVTPIGRFLRASRIDELPQIFNVLKGDMSFVGPRPERPEFVEDLEAKIPFYAERHYVKPGITGWAQIRFPYGASFEDSKRKLEYDLYYIKNYSLFLDLLIILQTARVVIFQKGAR